jgi:predicted Fe-Mo cluster-binding NifX family protein
MPYVLYIYIYMCNICKQSIIVLVITSRHEQQRKYRSSGVVPLLLPSLLDSIIVVSICRRRILAFQSVGIDVT